LLTLEQIAQRAAREARNESRVLIGSGLAEMVRRYLSERVRIVPSGNGIKSVDIAFVSVEQVCEQGGIARKPRSNHKPPGNNSNGRTLMAKRTVVIVPRASDNSKDIERLSRWAADVTKNREDLRVITELAVLDLTPTGIVIREVAPGVSARDVQQTTRAVLLAGPDLCEMRVEGFTG
jgi:3-oxoacid CoA-transferase subunit B